MTQAKANTARNGALDFTKGALVLLMVLYHWLNYFISADGGFYRYIRFVTPSFILISGFIVSNIYLSKYKVGDPRLSRRLFRRGAKLLGVFVLLNVLIQVVLNHTAAVKALMATFSLHNLVAVYVTGNDLVAGGGKVAAFYVLVPISYLLLLSAGLFVLNRFLPYVFHLAFFLFLAVVVVFSLVGIKSANLELLTIGFLGVVIGYVPTERINLFLRHPYAIVGTYICYLLAIAVWNATYPLQVVGVCLSVMLIYLLGVNQSQGGASEHVNLIGQYSLLGYIAQIAILQVLYRGFRHVDIGKYALAVSFLSAIVFTMLSVEIVDRVRARSTVVDGLYKAVFA